MDNMTYKQFIKYKCSDKQGSMITLSKFKKEHPEAYNAFSADYDMAYDRIIRANNLHCAKLDRGRLITEKTILENSNIKDVDKTYEESKSK